MYNWWWLLLIPAGLGAVTALFALDRLLLRLEEQGWIYYRKRGPSSSPLGAFVAFQKMIEPGMEHVVERKEQRDNAAVARERLLARLLACLEQEQVHRPQVRFHLAEAARAGVDWRQLYAEAVALQNAVRPERAALVPSPDEVAPE